MKNLRSPHLARPWQKRRPNNTPRVCSNVGFDSELWTGRNGVLSLCGVVSEYSLFPKRFGRIIKICDVFMQRETARYDNTLCRLAANNQCRSSLVAISGRNALSLPV